LEELTCANKCETLKLLFPLIKDYPKLDDYKVIIMRVFTRIHNRTWKRSMEPACRLFFEYFPGLISPLMEIMSGCLFEEGSLEYISFLLTRLQISYNMPYEFERMYSLAVSNANGGIALLDWLCEHFSRPHPPLTNKLFADALHYNNQEFIRRTLQTTSPVLLNYYYNFVSEHGISSKMIRGLKFIVQEKGPLNDQNWHAVIRGFLRTIAYQSCANLEDDLSGKSGLDVQAGLLWFLESAPLDERYAKCRETVVLLGLLCKADLREQAANLVERTRMADKHTSTIHNAIWSCIGSYATSHMPTWVAPWLLQTFYPDLLRAACVPTTTPLKRKCTPEAQNPEQEIDDSKVTEPIPKRSPV
jgi:hypothetical protein